MLSKKSKIEELRKSRKGQVLVVSVAASLCRACTKVCDRFAAIRCGPSRCPAWDPPAGLKNFVRQPEKTFSTASVKRRPRLATGLGLLYPQQRTSVITKATSVWCQERKQVKLVSLTLFPRSGGIANVAACLKRAESRHFNWCAQ